MSIFIDEVTRKLTAEGYKVSEEDGVLTTNLSGGEVMRFNEKNISLNGSIITNLRACLVSSHLCEMVV